MQSAHLERAAVQPRPLVLAARPGVQVVDLSTPRVLPGRQFIHLYVGSNIPVR